MTSIAFRYFFVGRCISLFGSSMTPVALALAVLGMKHDATALGVVLAAQFLAQLLFLLAGGAVADRVQRRRVLIWLNFAAGLTQALLAIALLDHASGLSAIAPLPFANGVAMAFLGPAERGIVPELVARDAMARATALLTEFCMGLPPWRHSSPARYVESTDRDTTGPALRSRWRGSRRGAARG